MLSGSDIVAKGATKIEVSLPELGLKDVTPNHSWLEQKQTQSALEARKQLVEVPRIEKRGILSLAEWNAELRLAEVLQPTGSHWQFLGHDRDKKKYLKPEEALYLMEVNCLLLRYNNVPVSLQEAYALLLSDQFSITHYKVYASLSRLGYKVYKHTIREEIESKSTTKNKNNSNDKDVNMDDNSNAKHEINDRVSSKEINEEKKDEQHVNNCISKSEEMEIDENSVKNKTEVVESKIEIAMTISSHDNEVSEQDCQIIPMVEEVAGPSCPEEIGSRSNEPSGSNTVLENDNKYLTSIPLQLDSKSNICDKDPLTRFYEWKLGVLKSRQYTQKPSIDAHKSFETFPDISQNQVVTINIPKEELIPKNIFLNNLNYIINVQNIQSKHEFCSPVASRTYSSSDEVNGDHIRRITSSIRQQNVGLPHFYQNTRHYTFRPYNFWRPQRNMNYFNFNLFFQRPFMPNFNVPRFQFYPRTHIPMFPRYYFNTPVHYNERNLANTPAIEEVTRKRRRDSAKKLHLESIKNLAVRLKQLIEAGNLQGDNIRALQRLIETYNVRYRTSLSLTSNFEIVNDEKIIETIELDDDDERKSKKPKIVDLNKSDSHDENLDNITHVAYKLKVLDAEGKASARHRRAISHLIKTFNKSYDADIYMTDNFEVLDRRNIVLDSSSDSDCIVEEKPNVKSGKKLRNPFNILKRLSDKQNLSTICTISKQENKEVNIDESHMLQVADNKLLEKTFHKNWLPNKNDFGKPEVPHNSLRNARIIESKKEVYLFEFLKNKPSTKFSNWVDAKVAFFESIEDTNAILQTGAMLEDNADLKSIIKPEDCTDMVTVLKKLNIIKSKTSVYPKSTISVHFDVYQRDVQNFRKASRPKPHFRVVCLDQHSEFLTGEDVASLHSKYEDKVTILFAVVGIDAISYLQMNPTEFPLYTRNNDFG